MGLSIHPARYSFLKRCFLDSGCAPGTGRGSGSPGRTQEEGRRSLPLPGCLQSGCPLHSGCAGLSVFVFLKQSSSSLPGAFARALLLPFRMLVP